MNNYLDKTVHICASMIGIGLAMRLTPQFELMGRISSEVMRVVFLFFLVVISTLLVNGVGGVDFRMFSRSKSEYIVNRLVCGFTAWGFVDIFLAVAKNELIGRVVFVVGVFLDVLISFLIFIFIRQRGRKSGGIVFLDNGLDDPVLVTELECGNFEIAVLNDIDSTGVIRFLNNKAPVAVIVKEGRVDPVFNQSIERDLGEAAMSPNLFRVRFFHRVPLEVIRGMNWWSIYSPLSSSELRLIKRIFDIIIAIVGLFLSIPVFFSVWLLNILFDDGPLIYSQVRLGQFGRPFRIFKIRTMRVGSEAAGPRWASIDDDRTTNIGRWLRKTRLDEIAQFWNVLVGDMSFIGPRPERPEMAEIICRSVPEFSVRLAAKPGITGWAQVNYPYGSSVEDSTRKLEYDIYYIQNAGLRCDFRILLRTVISMVKGAR